MVRENAANCRSRPALRRPAERATVYAGKARTGRAEAVSRLSQQPYALIVPTADVLLKRLFE